MIPIRKFIAHVLSLVRSTQLAGHTFSYATSSLELKSVISNLINNAVDAYGPEGGKVLLDLQEEHNSCAIRVKDQGAGIPTEYLAKLGRKSITFKGDRGSGLGLVHAFSKIESWNGSISIESTMAAGTTVSIRLPRYSADTNSASAEAISNAHRSSNGREVI